MSIKFCPLCDKKVDPVKKFSWPLFILLCCCAAAPGIIYLVYHLFFKSKNHCPICGTKKLISIDKAAKQATSNL